MKTIVATFVMLFAVSAMADNHGAKAAAPAAPAKPAATAPAASAPAPSATKEAKKDCTTLKGEEKAKCEAAAKATH